MNKNSSLIVQLVERLRSESPEFFKKLRMALIILSVIMGAIMTLIEVDVITFIKPTLATQIQHWLGYALAVTGGGIVVGSTATTNPKLMTKKDKDKVKFEVED